jgi:hypothetical protein
MTLASSPADVVAAVRGLVGEPGNPAAAGPGATATGPGLRRDERCRAFAARHTWAKRADTLAAAIGFPAVKEDRDGPSVLIQGR